MASQSAEKSLAELAGAIRGGQSLEKSLSQIIAQYQAAVAMGLTTVLKLMVPFYSAGAVAWSNMPLARTELFGGTFERFVVDLTGFTQFMLQSNVAVVGTAGAVLMLEYSLNQGGAWSPMDDTAQIGLASTGLRVSSWKTVPVAARTEVWLRIVGSGGDGAVDPQIVTLAALFK